MSDADPAELRARWRRYCRDSRRIWDERYRLQDEYGEWLHDLHERLRQDDAEAWRYMESLPGRRLPPEPRLPEPLPMPEELRGLSCGATTRAGTPCKRTDLYASGRCKFHGGLSTGPVTPEGKNRAARNGLRPKKKADPMIC